MHKYKFHKTGLLLALAFMASCEENTEQQISLYVSNPSEIDLHEKAVVIGREKLERGYEIGKFPYLTDGQGEAIPSQLADTDADGQWDALFFLLDLDAGVSAELHLEWKEEAPNWEERTYVRFGVRHSEGDTVRPEMKHTFLPDMLPGVMGYQPYQTDGPSWENDKVGFRHYLDGRNSKDVFGKKTSAMSPRNVGINADGVTEDNYHVMEDWGRDILSVGTSVGIGGYSLLIGDSLVRLGVTQRDSLNNVAATTFEVIESGPLLSVMEYDYQDWKPENTDRTYQVREIGMIWPGMYAYRSAVTFRGLQGDETGVLGLVNIHTEKSLEIMEIGKYTVLYTHDKQTYDKEWYLGLALVIPSASYQGWTTAPDSGQLTDSFLAKVKVREGSPVEYFAVACWELADPGFRDEAYFKSYLEDFTGQLDVELGIKVE